MLNPRKWERKGEIAYADALSIDSGEIRGEERQAGSESERHRDTDRDGAYVQTENQIGCRWLWCGIMETKRQTEEFNCIPIEHESMGYKERAKMFSGDVVVCEREK